MCADLGGLRACDGGLGADQCRLGAFAGGAGAVGRALLDRVGVGCVWLLACRQVEHLSGSVECCLLVVASFLGVIERLLADVAGELFAIDPRLRHAS